MKKKSKMKYCQRRTNKIVWRHDIGRSKQRWSTKRRSRRLRICFDSSRISLVFQCFWHLIGEKVSENQKGEKAKKTKNTFPICFSPLSSFPSFHVFFFSFFLSFSLFLSFFHNFFSLSFFFLSFFFVFSLSFWAKKITKSPKLSKITKNTKITKNHRNHRKCPKTL